MGKLVRLEWACQASADSELQEGGSIWGVPLPWMVIAKTQWRDFSFLTFHACLTPRSLSGPVSNQSSSAVTFLAGSLGQLTLSAIGS